MATVLSRQMATFIAARSARPEKPVTATLSGPRRSSNDAAPEEKETGKSESPLPINRFWSSGDLFFFLRQQFAEDAASFFANLYLMWLGRL